MDLNVSRTLSAAALLSVLLTAHTPASAAADTPEPALGAKMPDGTIFFGHDSRNFNPLYAMPADAPSPSSWIDATQYCQTLQSSNFHDWRLPTKEELATLYANRDQGALKGTFNSSSTSLSAWYWSSTQDAYVDMFWQQNFNTGQTNSFHKTDPVSVRCVRGENSK